MPWTRDEEGEMLPSEPGMCDTGGGAGRRFVAQYCPTDYSSMVLIGLCLYLVSFQSGLGPVPWIVNAEVGIQILIFGENVWTEDRSFLLSTFLSSPGRVNFCSGLYLRQFLPYR